MDSKIPKMEGENTPNSQGISLKKKKKKSHIGEYALFSLSVIIKLYWENNGNSDRLYFLQLQNHCRRWLQPWNEKTLAPWKKSYDQPRLWCWTRLFRVPLTARRPNQSILKEINPEYSLEGLILRLKSQYFGHLMRRADSFANLPIHPTPDFCPG